MWTGNDLGKFMGELASDVRRCMRYPFHVISHVPQLFTPFQYKIHKEGGVTITGFSNRLDVCQTEMMSLFGVVGVLCDSGNLVCLY